MPGLIVVAEVDAGHVEMHTRYICIARSSPNILQVALDASSRETAAARAALATKRIDRRMEREALVRPLPSGLKMRTV